MAPPYVLDRRKQRPRLTVVVEAQSYVAEYAHFGPASVRVGSTLPALTNGGMTEVHTPVAAGVSRGQPHRLYKGPPRLNRRVSSGTEYLPCLYGVLAGLAAGDTTVTEPTGLLWAVCGAYRFLGVKDYVGTSPSAMLMTVFRAALSSTMSSLPSGRRALNSWRAG